MNLRRIIPTDMTASAMAHLSLLALVLLFSEVHPFGAVTAEPIAVDIVASQEIAERSSRKSPRPRSPSRFRRHAAAAISRRSTSRLRASCACRRQPSRRRRAAAEAGRTGRHRRSRRQPHSRSRAATAAARRRRPTRRPSLISPSNTMCCSGLPPDLSPTCRRRGATAHDKAGDNFDAPATEAADVASSVVADFRRHLRTCSKLPASLTAVRRRQGQAAGVDDARKASSRRSRS